jgi:hypothetical protein
MIVRLLVVDLDAANQLIALGRRRSAVAAVASHRHHHLSTDEVCKREEGGGGDWPYYDRCEGQLIWTMDNEVILSADSPRPLVVCRQRSVSSS